MSNITQAELFGCKQIEEVNIFKVERKYEQRKR
jgi:hypothetical protein